MPPKPRDLVCPGCDHDLSAGFQGRSMTCPECGRTVEKAEARQVVRRRAAARARLSAWLLALSLALMILLYTLVGRPQDVPCAPLLWVLAWLPGAAGIFTYTRDQRPALGPLWIPAAILAAIVWAVASTLAAVLVLLMTAAARA